MLVDTTINVICNNCKTENLDASIGYLDMDLCASNINFI